MFEDKSNILDNNRILYMSGEITEQRAELIVSKLFQFECTNPTKDILLIIDSYGGSVDSFVAMHDTIRLLRCDVATCCIGKAMSCGQLLLISGQRGKRFITPNSRVMMHEFTLTSHGKLTDVDNTITETKRLQKLVWEDLHMKYTKLNKQKLRDLKSKDAFLNAKECLTVGFVDHIVSSASELYKNINV